MKYGFFSGYGFSLPIANMELSFILMEIKTFSSSYADILPFLYFNI